MAKSVQRFVHKSWVNLGLLLLIVAFFLLLVSQWTLVPPLQEKMTTSLDTSGNVVDLSGCRLDASGNVLDVSGCVALHPPSVKQSTGTMASASPVVPSSTVILPSIMNPSTLVTSTYIKK